MFLVKRREILLSPMCRAFEEASCHYPQQELNDHDSQPVLLGGLPGVAASARLQAVQQAKM
jgi:alanine dehydrogenase